MAPTSARHGVLFAEIDTESAIISKISNMALPDGAASYSVVEHRGISQHGAPKGSRGIEQFQHVTQKFGESMPH
jgi:hypothetical protein